MGWLRVPNQPDSPPRVGADAAGPVLCARVRGLQHPVLCRDHTVNADLLRGLPTGAELGAYAGEFRLRIFLFVNRITY